MGVSSVCVEEGERRSEEERGARRRSVGRSVGRSAAGAAPKVRTPHNDVGNDIDLIIIQISMNFRIIFESRRIKF